MSFRPLRSVLYMPASNQRAMDKARNLPADAIIFDLEDAVAPDAKATARQMAVAQIQAGGYGTRQLILRCNSFDGPWGREDLLAAADSGVDVVCLPKIETVAQLAAAREILDAQGRQTVGLWAMIETPAGVSNVDALAAFPSLQALVMGTTDLAYELRIPHRVDRLGLQYALSRCVLAARAQGIVALDGVTLDLADEAGLIELCEQGRALGFDGKTLIHPKQLEAANHAFGLSAEGVAHAQAVITVWEKAEAEGLAVVLLEGKLVEAMHVDEARRTLQVAAQIADLEAATA